MRQGVILAEDRLRTGWFIVTTDYPDGTRSTENIRFDRGDGRQPRRMHYQATLRGRSEEYILYGDQLWQRQSNGSWSLAKNADVAGLVGRVESYLPTARSAQASSVAVLAPSAAQPVSSVSTTEVRWRDASGSAEVTVEVDPASGTPRQMRRVDPANGRVVHVTYRAWNTPVDIDPPSVR